MTLHAHEYLLFEHQGARCVTVASDVFAVRRSPEGREERTIWGGNPEPTTDETRYLQLTGAPEVLRAREVRATVREKLDVVQLPPLLRRQLPAPVVGIVELDGHSHWVLSFREPE
ncbi:MAG: hypothetical protein AAF654_09545 [Myxococcota bacterium]